MTPGSLPPIILPAGSIPALVTPMLRDGSLDWKSYHNLIDWRCETGPNGIVVMGSTGEAATVSKEGHSDLIRVAVYCGLPAAITSLRAAKVVLREMDLERNRASTGQSLPQSR